MLSCSVALIVPDAVGMSVTTMSMVDDVSSDHMSVAPLAALNRITMLQPAVPLRPCSVCGTPAVGLIEHEMFATALSLLLSKASNWIPMVVWLTSVAVHVPPSDALVDP